MKKLISENLFHESLDDEEPFFFNVSYDEKSKLVNWPIDIVYFIILFYYVCKDEPIIGDGEKERVHIMLTSKKLMRNIEYKGTHHIDGTYKITCFGYPLIVYGVSDHCGHFHPVCFAIVSGEKTEEFKHFYHELIDLCVELKLKFMPEFIMQDAQPASRAGAFEIFKHVKFLMCYFHVKKM